MKYGLYFKNSQNEPDWLRESDMSISVWSTQKDADYWRKSHTVNPSKYEIKEVTEKIIKEDMNATASSV